MEGLLNDLSLNEALQTNKLFIVNHSILDNIDELSDRKQEVSPFVAFFHFFFHLFIFLI